MAVEPLHPDRLYRRIDIERFDFRSTAEVEELGRFIGQERAVQAVRFGIRMRPRGYNLFVLRPAGTGKHSLVSRCVKEQANQAPVPDDWCYVQNFEEEHKPNALRLPPGRGAELERDMEDLVEDLAGVIGSAFESDEYRSKVQAVEKVIERHQEALIADVKEKAERNGIALITTSNGFTLAPLRNVEPLTPEEFQDLDEEEREAMHKDIERIQDALEAHLHKLPKWHTQTREKVEALNRRVVEKAIRQLLEATKEKYRDLPQIEGYLDQVRADVIEHYRHFLPQERSKARLARTFAPSADADESRRTRYRVNVIVTHPQGGGAPIIHEDQPAYNNLMGRIEHRTHMGALETDFTMIRCGALHRADPVRTRLLEEVARGERHWPGERPGRASPRRLLLWIPGAHHGAHPPGERAGTRHRARGGARRTAPLQGGANPLRLSRRALCTRAPPLPVRQSRLRAVLWGRGGRQRLLRGALRPPLLPGRRAHPTVPGGHRVRQPARRGSAHRRGHEKIEGFFDVCRTAGLTGDQGVLIPGANVKHLMLREDVRQACTQRRFAVYPVTRVDEGIELLTGLAAGKRDAKGRFPEGSLNHRVERRLIDYAERIGRLQERWPSKEGPRAPRNPTLEIIP